MIFCASLLMDVVILVLTLTYIFRNKKLSIGSQSGESESTIKPDTDASRDIDPISVVILSFYLFLSIYFTVLICI